MGTVDRCAGQGSPGTWVVKVESNPRLKCLFGIRNKTSVFVRSNTEQERIRPVEEIVHGESSNDSSRIESRRPPPECCHRCARKPLGFCVKEDKAGSQPLSSPVEPKAPESAAPRSARGQGGASSIPASTPAHSLQTGTGRRSLARSLDRRLAWIRLPALGSS